ncbi:MAG TPA: DivIVA domain-containing protein [Gaiellaceae bacterium]|nr:DivIVA domain-containing protein [Gaiellaceae bacterium]
MPIKPDEIDASKLPRGFRGYKRAATDDLLQRIALDYRQISRAPEALAKEAEWLKSRIAELEERAAAHETEAERLVHVVRGHEERQALIEAMLVSAQRTAQDIRDAAEKEAAEVVRTAEQRAVEIERDARAAIRQTTVELDRLRTLESDLRTRLRQTLEAALGDQ